MLYYISNISETKALVPSITYDAITITAETTNVTYVLHNFNGICGINNVCQNNLFISMQLRRLNETSKDLTAIVLVRCASLNLKYLTLPLIHTRVLTFQW